MVALSHDDVTSSLQVLCVLKKSRGQRYRLQRIAELGDFSLVRKARHDSDPFEVRFAAPVERAFCPTTRPLLGLGRVMGSRYDALFWTKEATKWSSPSAVKLSKKEIRRPIQGPFGAVEDNFQQASV